MLICVLVRLQDKIKRYSKLLHQNLTVVVMRESSLEWDAVGSHIDKEFFVKNNFAFHMAISGHALLDGDHSTYDSCVCVCV